MPALVELRKASAGYAGRAVLHDINLTISAGERVAVMGRSGAGKSTLLNLIHARLTDRVALIPQAAALVKTLSVFHNVYMGRLDRYPTWHNLRTLVWPARRDVAEIKSMLELVGLADKLFERAGTLSGGQQQRASSRARSTTTARSSLATNRYRRWIGTRAPRFSASCARATTPRSSPCTTFPSRSPTPIGWW